jgi:hypothetical protein
MVCSAHKDYLSPSVSLSSLPSLFTGSGPVMPSATISTAIISILAPIGSESMAIHGTAKCAAVDGIVRSCAPVWTLNMVCIRILQGLMAMLFILFMTFTLFNLQRRDAGVFDDPSSISTTASLVGNNELVNEIRSLPSGASNKEIKDHLRDNRYSLAEYSHLTGNNSS